MSCARITLSLALLFLVAPFPVSACDPVMRVEQFIAAFNERNLEGMLALAHEGIEWYSISGGQAHLETSGKAALSESLRAYFQRCPSCQSEISITGRNGHFVSARETATWERHGKRMQQASLSVYELEQGTIRRVWYYEPVRVGNDD